MVIGGVVRIADTVRVSRTTMRIPRRHRYRRKLLSWRRRQLVWVTTSLFGRQRSSGERTRNTPKETQWPEEHCKAHRGQAKLDQQRIQTPRVREWQENLRVRKETLRVAYEEIKILREDLLREGRIDGQKQEPHHVSGEHGRNSNPRRSRIGFLERSGFEETGWMNTRRFSGRNRGLDVGSSETQQGS